MRKICIIGAVAFLFTACRPSVNISTPPAAGSAKFVNYLALGDNYTGGYTDGSLTVTGQLYSYPAMLFQQFSMIQGANAARGPFIQPLIHSDNGYPTPKLVLGMTYSVCDSTDSTLAPVLFPNFLADPIDNQRYVSPANNGQINNIGVLGIRVADLPVMGWASIVNTLNGVPYAYRFFNDPTSTPLKEIEHRVNNLYPTFFTMSYGMNDVLLYAIKGGQGDGTGNALPIALNLYSPNDITPTKVFDTNYNYAVNEAIITGASGALLNVPDITALPFFNAIPANGLVLDRQGQADTLLKFWGSSSWKKVFQPGNNFFIIRDHNNQIRQAVPGELILMTVPLDSIKCAGWGATYPIPDSFVLTTDELQFIRTATDAYNSFISFECKRHNLAYVDINALFKSLPGGIMFDGIKYNNQFVLNGAFSLDGIHMTPRGYALIANEVIKAINAAYGSTIQQLDVNKYKGITFPPYNN